jgi:hypothetical protein
MSTRRFRSVSDFSRFRQDVELECRCGHKAVLPFGQVVARFVARGWPKGIEMAWQHFRCSRCGARPCRVGPMER